jgi:hypothetical protein
VPAAGRLHRRHRSRQPPRGAKMVKMQGRLFGAVAISEGSSTPPAAAVGRFRPVQVKPDPGPVPARARRERARHDQTLRRLVALEDSLKIPAGASRAARRKRGRQGARGVPRRLPPRTRARSKSTTASRPSARRRRARPGIGMVYQRPRWCRA